jgi:cell division protein FtsN
MNLPPCSRAQRGGTLLGFVGGLLLGLLIALLVAVYVTKVPVPLLDRGVQRPTTSEAVEAERLRDWNPNANLSSSRPAAAGADAGATPSAPANASPVPAGTESRPPTTDAIGQLIEQRAGAGTSAVATVEATADPFLYFVQAGAFRQAEEAEAQRARLAMMGFEASVSEREQAGRLMFRVRIGPFERRLDADLVEQKVLGQGVDAAVVRVQR